MVSIMLTLTYRGVGHWNALQISDMMSWVKDEWDAPYVWVMELQKRGEPHYHVLTAMPAGVRWDKDKIEYAWYWGLVWVSSPVRRPQYLLKYLQKGGDRDGKKYPKGARIVGSTAPARGLDDEENAARRASRFPGWVRRGLEPEEIYDLGSTGARVAGGVAYGGKFVASPFAVDTAAPGNAHSALIPEEQHIRPTKFGKVWYND
jgi:hypothetical protein